MAVVCSYVRGRGSGVREGARLAAYLICTKGGGSGWLAWPLFVYM